MEQSEQTIRSWRREDETGEYAISTSLQLLDHAFINSVFTTDEAYWTGPINDSKLFTLMLSQSLNFGLYQVVPARRERSSDSPSSPRTPSPTLEENADESLKQIGIARFVTDHVTFVYITDVYIVPEHRGKGLGSWLMECWKDVLEDMPQLRRAVLLTSFDRTKKWYEAGLGMWDSREEGEGFHVMIRKRY